MRRSKSSAASLRYALDGILLSYKTQRHLRFHLLLAAGVLGLGIAVRLTRLEMAVLLLCISLVVLTELVNTALEAAVDLATPDYHRLARVAKDVAAGAVLVAAVNAVLVGTLLFAGAAGFPPRLRRPIQVDTWLGALSGGFLIILIVLVAWKVGGGRGRFLSGGPVSGHTALAFFLATTLFLAAPHPLVALLAICLALLVPQSRLEAGIHSGREVIWGALLGMGVPLFLAVALPWLLRAGPAWGGRGS